MEMGAEWFGGVFGGLMGFLIVREIIRNGCKLLKIKGRGVSNRPKMRSFSAGMCARGTEEKNA